MVLAFFFSLLQANWTYTGYDASAHVAEETVGARVASAWGIFLSVAVSAVVGFIFLRRAVDPPAGSLDAVPDTLDDAAAAASASTTSVAASPSSTSWSTTSASSAACWRPGIAIAMAFCGLSSVASAGRMLFAFSRDDGVPGVGLAQEGLARAIRTPANSLIAIVVVVAGCSRWRVLIVGARRRPSSSSSDGDQHDLPVRRVRDRASTSARRPGVAQRARLEPRPLVQAHRAGMAVVWILVLMVLFSCPDVGQHQLAVHGRRPSLFLLRLLLRAGRARTVQGSARHGRRRRADRDRDGSSSRPPGSSGPDPPDRRHRIHAEGRPALAGRPSTQPPTPSEDDDERPRQAHAAKHPRLAELEGMVRDGQIDTIVVAITDMQGRLMGKRVQGQAFLDGVISHGAHFCTYLLGTDMEMNTPEGFKLMNWETGYGDWIAEPVWDQLRVLPWLPGHGDGPRRHHRRGDRRRRSRSRRGRSSSARSPGPRTPASRSRPAPSSSSTSSRTPGRSSPSAAGRSRGRSATTTRTTTCSRPPRPSRSTACCATR